MEDEARRRIRRAMLARKAVSPKLRGQYQRAVHAKRIEAEAKQAPPHPPGTDPLAPAPAARRGIAVVVFFAVLPMLVLVAAGAYAINLLTSVEKAQSDIFQESVGKQLRDAGYDNAVIPTNTPDARGVIATLEPTAKPRATDVPPPVLSRNDPFTVLLIGVDARDPQDVDPPQSDTMILAYVDPVAKRMNLLSVPRDLLMQQAGGRGPAKLADIYAAGERSKFPGGGVGFVWATLEQNLGVKIDYYAQVDFNGFKKIIDAVGGVTVDNPYPIKDDDYPTEDYQYTRVYFPAGTMHLGGEEALKYARTRHGDNDFQRNARQQQVILAVREQAAKTDLFGQANSLLDALAGTFKTDIPQKDLLALAGLAKGVNNDGLRQFSFNNLIIDPYPGPNPNIAYVGLNWAEARKLVKEFSTPYVNTDAANQQKMQGANTSLRVTVQNGTKNGGLAQRWSNALSRQGYGKIEDGYVDAPPDKKGKLPQTKILCFGKNEETARVIAKTMGLPPSAVDIFGARPPEAPLDADIVVVLGNDAKEPEVSG